MEFLQDKEENVVWETSDWSNERAGLSKTFSYSFSFVLGHLESVSELKDFIINSPKETSCN